jgi:hypothetical protein
MNIATQVRQSAARSGSSLREMCEQECTAKLVSESNRTVEFLFSDKSTIDMLATQDDME